MQSNATTPDEYIAGLPDDRKTGEYLAFGTRILEKPTKTFPKGI